jgi:hypothetical protein
LLRFAVRERVGEEILENLVDSHLSLRRRSHRRWQASVFIAIAATSLSEANNFELV